MVPETDRDPDPDRDKDQPIEEVVQSREEEEEEEEEEEKKPSSPTIGTHLSSDPSEVGEPSTEVGGDPPTTIDGEAKSNNKKKKKPRKRSSANMALTVSVPGVGVGRGDPRSFSQLLAGAMAAGSSPATPPMMAVPVVAVPCFIGTPNTLLDPSGITGQFAISHQAVLASVTAQAQMQLHAGFISPSSSHFPLGPMPLQQHPTEKLEETDTKSEEANNPGRHQHANNIKATSGDGYNWRKYGQKQVKSSESWRSYYRCTQAACSAKKKVERCIDGRVIEVIYQGQHNHEPPLKAKFSKGRVIRCSAHPGDGGSSDRDNGSGCPNGSDTNPRSGTEGAEQLHCSSDCERDASIKMEEDAQEPDSKRRLCESPVASSTPFVRTVKEQKVVVQSVGNAVSDGYRWRKYGQKSIKGSPNPRSYYKCTHVGCPARKHVEKASEEGKSIVITYEGNHVHDSTTRSGAGGVNPNTAALVPTASASMGKPPPPISPMDKSSVEKSSRDEKCLEDEGNIGENASETR